MKYRTYISLFFLLTGILFIASPLFYWMDNESLTTMEVFGDTFLYVAFGLVFMWVSELINQNSL